MPWPLSPALRAPNPFLPASSLQPAPNSRNSRLTPPLVPSPSPFRDPTPPPLYSRPSGPIQEPLLTPTPPPHFNPLEVSAAEGAENRKSILFTSASPTPISLGPRLKRPGGDCEITQWWAGVGEHATSGLSKLWQSLEHTCAPPGQFSLPRGKREVSISWH